MIDDPTDVYREHTLPSGFTIIMDWTNNNMRKPYEVMCIHSNGEDVQWVRSFATREEAEAEYIRFD